MSSTGGVAEQGEAEGHQQAAVDILTSIPTTIMEAMEPMPRGLTARPLSSAEYPIRVCRNSGSRAVAP
jgi:hypothetical protein